MLSEFHHFEPLGISKMDAPTLCLIVVLIALSRTEPSCHLMITITDPHYVSKTKVSS